MQKFIIWFSVERYRASAFFRALIDSIKLQLQTPFAKMLLESIWHTFALLVVGAAAALLFGVIFPPLFMLLYLLMYPMIFVTFIVLLILVIWLRPFVNKLFDTVTAIVLAFISSRKAN